MAFELLSNPIKRFIRDKGWEEFRPIQAAAIKKIIASDEHFILASRTASGKTEAAFLPILSKVNFNESGVQVLYISPLIALINDQFHRVEELCKYLDVSITKWHGEANRTLKTKLLNEPNGIVLITPESLEAMFVNKPYNVKLLFSTLRYVVIDEIHSFIGTDRGIQLKSLLSRLQGVNKTNFSIVGLSATIGDYKEAKNFTGDENRTTVLLDRTTKEVSAAFRFFRSKTEEYPLELLKDLYRETKNNKVLIFPNSRGRAEEVAVKLKKISNLVKGHHNYFSHHSSVDREVREYVEHFAKKNVRENFCISCTSTLELGIDIGSVDEVVQIDATYSIASLIQRIGRSGRRDGATSNLFLYATNEWSLLQALACWQLLKEGFIEPSDVNDTPYDILLHQALSITKSRNGIPYHALITELKANTAFAKIREQEIIDIIQHLLSIDFLEKIQDELIIGIGGEKIVNDRAFYSVFKSEENYKVLSAGVSIGDIPFSPQIMEDENILLAAKVWKIVFVDHDTKKIEVKKAIDGKKPSFSGVGGNIHPRIRQKMYEILLKDDAFEELNDACNLEIKELRKFFSTFEIKDAQAERPFHVSNKRFNLYTFAGTKINQTICFFLDRAGIKNSYYDHYSVIEVNISAIELKQQLDSALDCIDSIDFDLAKLLKEKPSLIGFSKWGGDLPIRYQVELIKQRYFDFEGVAQFKNIYFLQNK